MSVINKDAQHRTNDFWQDIHIDCHIHPYTIMFQVDDNCPVYMHDYRDWVDYFLASYPSDTVTAFVVEGEVSLNNIRTSILFKRIYEITMDTLVWSEHGGVTTA